MIQCVASDVSDCVPVQVEEFSQFVMRQQVNGRNARPVQPSNGRPVVYDCLSLA